MIWGGVSLPGVGRSFIFRPIKGIRTSDMLNQTNLVTLLNQWIKESNNPDVLAYGSSFLKHLDRHIWAIRNMMSLGRMSGGKVLDIGCGFGWEAVVLAYHGAREVVCNDVRPLMTQFVGDRVRALAGGGAVLPLKTLLGDICSMNLPNDEFDAIFCNQTVEHVHTLESMFAVAYRTLKTGGHMVIANDNNALTSKDIPELERMWKRRDRSMDYIAQLKRDRPIENADIEPYAVMREKIIATVRPDLPVSEVSRLSDATAGMIEPDIERVARNHVPDRSAMPVPPQFSWCRNPVTGEYCERQLNPFELADMLRKVGFTVKLRHAFRRFPLSLLNGQPLSHVNRLIFKKKASFVIVAEKKRRG
jgi:SAM-dependent methyltransferase